MPTTSAEPTSHPSLRPSVSNKPSVSIAPSEAGAFPSSQPSGSVAPSADPTGSYNVRQRAKCENYGDENDYLPDVVIIAYRVVYSEWTEVGRIVADADGYYEFNGLDSPTRDNRYIFVIEDSECFISSAARRNSNFLPSLMHYLFFRGSLLRRHWQATRKARTRGPILRHRREM